MRTHCESMRVAPQPLKGPELVNAMRYTCQGNSLGDASVPPMIRLEMDDGPLPNPQTTSVNSAHTIFVSNKWMKYLLTCGLICVNLDSAFHSLVPISVISTRFRPDRLESTETWGLSVMEQWYSASSEMINKSESPTKGISG